MKMINQKFGTSNGKHRLHTVRSMGRGQGFGVVDKLRNWIVVHPFWTRKAAWEYLRKTNA